MRVSASGARVLPLRHRSIDPFFVDDDGISAVASKYPPAKPEALSCEPLKAAVRGR